MLLTAFLETEYIPRRLRGKSKNSVRLYRLCIRQFSLTLGRSACLADLTEDNILLHLARRSDVAPATRNKELAELTALWRLAVQRGLHTGWPSLQPEPEPERAPIAWLAEEMQKLLGAATRQQGEIGGVKAWLWWHGLIRFTLDTGERISAVRTARWNWIQGEWALVPAEYRKAKTRDRRYRMSQATIEVLEQIRAQKACPVQIFPWPYCDGYLWDKYKVLLIDAGLPITRKHQFHALRKTSASVAHAAGLDATDALDHSDRRTTQRYLDPRFTRDRQPCDVLAEFLANPRKPDDDSKQQKRTG